MIVETENIFHVSDNYYFGGQSKEYWQNGYVMTEKSKVIFGNKVSDKDYNSALKSKKSYIKKCKKW